MKAFFQKPFAWTAVFSLLLTSSVAYTMLHTFVIPRAITSSVVYTTAASVTSDSTGSSAESETSDQAGSMENSGAAVTDTSYKDANIEITITALRKYDTDIYIADVKVASAAYLKTAFAHGTCGRNIKDTTSGIAQENNAVFAVNGDYYGFRDNGFVLRNGVLYRSTAAEDTQALVIDSSGNFSVVDESAADAETLAENGAWQILSFGPALVENGSVCVDESTEVGQSMMSNPRTAVGQISALHYLFIVSDGRTSASAGLSLYELAGIFVERGCSVAYNLDGGGSSTMWFNGTVINNPTDGRSGGERSISDIVYIG